ncbi:G5 domain-containing protein [Candidatus Saccharibacteria bacterium]|nr:G5 domain-containing protein [Candidatus Saccharibacteria bacterium]
MKHGYLSKLISRTWKRLHHHGHRHVRRRPYILPIFGLLLGAAIVGSIVVAKGGNTYGPSNSHVVFLFDKGKKTTLNTKAATVGDLINKIPLKLIPEDVVEPSRDTPIEEDNFRVNVYRARPVTVVDTASRTVTLTAQKSPRVVAQAAGLPVYAEDNVSFAAGDINKNILGEQVVINRATAVQLNLYGDPLTIRTRTKTVGELLKEKEIKLEQGDSIQPVAETPLSPNIQIFVSRMGVQISTVEQAIPVVTQTITDASLSLGASVVRQAGTPGKRVLTYQIETKNGQEVSRKIIQQVVIQEPVPRIVARGNAVSVTGGRTEWMVAAGIASSNHGYVNYIVSRESNWNYLAKNSSSGAYGLCQALPGSKMVSAGADWATNPVTQLRWCNGYATARYGSWAAAYNFWIANRYW